MLAPVFALLEEDFTVIPKVRVETLADLWFYAVLFFMLAGTVFAIAVLMGKNASHSIGSMRSLNSGAPHVPTGGRFSGPAVHGRW